MSAITIGNISAGPGTRRAGFLEIAKNADGTGVNLPVILVNGAKKGPVLLIDGAVHGDEQEGTMGIIELTKKLDPAKLKGTLIAVPAVNTIGFHLRMRGNPFDLMYVDMNRIFPGHKDSFSISDRIVYEYWNQIILKSNYIISFHGGGGVENSMVPRVIIQEDIGPEHRLIEDSLNMAKAMAMSEEWVITGKSEHTKRQERTMQLECANAGKPAMLIEIGGGVRSQEVLDHVVDLIVNGVQNVMRWAGMLDEKPKYPQSWRRIEEYSMLRARNGGILHYDNKYDLNAIVDKGTVLATVENLVGEQVDTITMPYDGVVIARANTISRKPNDLVAMVGTRPFWIK